MPLRYGSDGGALFSEAISAQLRASVPIEPALPPVLPVRQPVSNPLFDMDGLAALTAVSGELGGER